MTSRRYLFVTGTIAGLLLIVLMIAVSIVLVGDNEVAVIERLDGKMEVLDDEGIYFRPFSKHVSYPKNFTIWYGTVKPIPPE